MYTDWSVLINGYTTITNKQLKDTTLQICICFNLYRNPYKTVL